MKQPYVILAAVTLAALTGGAVFWSMLPEFGVPVDAPHTRKLTTPKVGTPAPLERRASRSQDTDPHLPVGQPRIVPIQAPQPAEQDPQRAQASADTRVDSPSGHEPGDARDATQWADEVNRRVLGPRQWMAVPTPEETARVQAILNEPIPYDPRVSPTDRRGSITAVRQEVEACVAQARRQVPGARGRLVVSWDVVAHQGVGQISAVEVDPVIGFEQNPELTTCVLDRVQGKTFTAEHEGERLQVQYPFFFDRN